MKKKLAAKKITKKNASIRNMYITRTIIFWVALFVVGLFVTHTKQWFFLTTSKEQVDFGADGTFDYGSRLAILEGKQISVSPPSRDSLYAQVLGESSSNKRIEIDLSSQKLFAYEGDNRVFDFSISSGKPWWATPTGVFKTWIKLRYTRMRGGSHALGTFYDLPNVPYTMFFANEKIPKWKGYGVHGAYWHNNFGYPMSHGCVNMRIEDAEKLFYWTDPPTGEKGVVKVTDENQGTTVIIYGKTPTS